MTFRPTTWEIDTLDRLPVQVISPAPRDIWQELMESDPEAIVPQSPQWVDVICAAENFSDASRLYEFPDGRVWVLPMVRQRLPLPGLSRQASMPPGWGIGGLIGGTLAGPEEISAIGADLARGGALTTSIRPNPLTGPLWQAARLGQALAEPRLAHVLDLEGGFDHVWANRFTHGARKSIRRAERSGLQVEFDNTGKHIPIYYELMMRSVQRWARNQHEPLALSRWRARRRDPLEKFKTIARVLGSSLHTWVAFLDGRPAAATLMLLGRNAYGLKSAIDIEVTGKTGASELLKFHAIRAACEAGCRRYHMGESGRSSSLAFYKEHLGAEPYPYAEYYFERIPLTRLDRLARRLVKRVIGFRDAG